MEINFSSYNLSRINMTDFNWYIVFEMDVLDTENCVSINGAQ